MILQLCGYTIKPEWGSYYVEKKYNKWVYYPLKKVRIGCMHAGIGFDTMQDAKKYVYRTILLDILHYFNFFPFRTMKRFLRGIPYFYTDEKGDKDSAGVKYLTSRKTIFEDKTCKYEVYHINNIDRDLKKGKGMPQRIEEVVYEKHEVGPFKYYFKINIEGVGVFKYRMDKLPSDYTALITAYQKWFSNKKR